MKAEKTCVHLMFDLMFGFGLVNYVFGASFFIDSNDSDLEFKNEIIHFFLSEENKKKIRKNCSQNSEGGESLETQTSQIPFSRKRSFFRKSHVIFRKRSFFF